MAKLELPERPVAVDELQEELQRCFDALLYKDRQGYLGSFIQGLIHNINGPLQNMSMLAELITAGQERADQFVSRYFAGDLGAWKQIQDKQKQRVQQISDQIAKVVEMLRDLVYLLELERTDGEIDVNLMVSRLFQVLRADLFFKHQVEVELRLAPGLPLANIAASQFIVALVHLFRNAMLALREATVKRLVVETCWEEGQIWVSLRDTGCGYGPEPVEKLFEPFRSGWSAEEEVFERHEKQLGLGLFIARTTLLPYGANVTLSRENQETVASVRIPAIARKS